jgi:hypothetical protein
MGVCLKWYVLMKLNDKLVEFKGMVQLRQLNPDYTNEETGSE